MRTILTARQAKDIDRFTSSTMGVPSIVLMERAALAVSQEVVTRLDDRRKSVLFVCGSGNNGGDGLACARILAAQGYDVCVLMIGNKEYFTESTKIQYQAVSAYQIPVYYDYHEVPECGIIVDAIFGIGLSRDIEGKYAETIEWMNHVPCEKIAVDLPSGIEADSGRILGNAVHCDVTVTFNYAKPGHYLGNGADYTGELIIADAGIADINVLNEKHIDQPVASPGLLESPDDSDLRKVFTGRDRNGNKGTFGKVLVIAGCASIQGAAILSASAALHTGCGMVRVYTSEINRPVIAAALPEALITTYHDHIDEDALHDAINWSDAIVMGPGMGTDKFSHQILDIVMSSCSVPMVLDADAINIISENTQRLLAPHTELVLTPHMGEMSRLTGDSISYLKEHLVSAAVEFANEYQVTLVMKDARTVTAVPYDHVYLNLSGNSGMATAGSGDVLSGIIAGFLAQHVPPDKAAAIGVYFHGKCGDAAARKVGKYYMTAGDIIRTMPEVIPPDEGTAHFSI